MGAAQGVLRVFPFYRILDDPPDGIGRGLSLDEIVLRTFMQRLHPDRFIIERRQNHHGHAVRAIAETQEGGQALAVRQGQVQQNDVDLFGGEQFQPNRKPLGADEVKLHPRGGERTGVA